VNSIEKLAAAQVHIITNTAPSSFQIGDPATVAKKLKLTEAALASAH
jgi:hypothetical protein